MNSHTRVRTGRAVTAVLVAGVLSFSVEGVAFADPSAPPGTSTSASPPVKVDPKSPGLKMADGATLAPSKVLDIKSIVESQGGEERREDTNQDIKFALQAEVLFGKDSAKLSSAATSRITAIGAEVKKQNATKVRIFGFTDNLGSSEHGDVLSKQRADAVHGVLSKELGSSITFEIRGYGEDFPIATNDDEEGRKKNRRVEVAFPRGDSDQG